jgi:hypothetical protein
MALDGENTRYSYVYLFAFAFLVSSGLQAHIKAVLDFDGTIVNDHHADSGWRTYWRLKKVEHPHNSLQVAHLTEGPATIEISFAEYRRLLPRLAKGEALLGDLNPQPLDADPLNPKRPNEIIPGIYRVSDDISYARFRPNPSGKSFLLEDYATALKREEQTRGKSKWRGIAFPLLEASVEAQGNKEGPPTRSVVISTDRVNDESEFEQMFRKEFGVKAEIRYHLLNSPEGIFFGPGPTERKVGVVAKEAEELLTGLHSTHQELVTDEVEAKAGKMAAVKTLIVAEDNPIYLEAIIKKMQALSSELRYTNQIKFVLLNAAYDVEVESNRWPWRWTVFDKGFGRQALPEEVRLWVLKKDHKSCVGLIAES